jgi:Flp pilus assembly protein TadB
MASLRAALREAASMFGLTRGGRARDAAVTAEAPYVRALSVMAGVGLLVYLVAKDGVAHWVGLAVFVSFALAALAAWVRTDRRLRR